MTPHRLRYPLTTHDYNDAMAALGLHPVAAMRDPVKAMRTAATVRLDDAEVDIETRLRCVHALTQSLGTFAKLSEAADLEKRIEKLEAAYRKENPGTLRRAV